MIGKNSVVGSNTEIQNDAHILSSVIGRKCEVGHNSVIRDSYVWDKTIIGADCIIEESIIGANVRVLEGTTIKRGCLIGQGVVLGPHASLEKFQRVSRHPPKDEDEDWDSVRQCGRSCVSLSVF